MRTPKHTLGAMRVLSLVALIIASPAEADDVAVEADDVAPEAHDVAPEAPSSFLGETDHAYLFEAAARSGYATVPIRGGVNPFGAGFGARAGFDVWHLYLGASVMDYLGGSDVGATDKALLAGVEVGFSANIGRYFTLRPQFGLGDTILMHTEPAAAGTVDVVTSASGTSSTSGTSGTSGATTQVKNLYLQPSLTAMFKLHRFFFALDGGALLLPGIVYGPAPAQETMWICYSVDAQLGFRL